MSLHDFKRAAELGDAPFDAIVMAAMRRADSENLEKLKRAFPEVWFEFRERYNGPGGLTREEHAHAVAATTSRGAPKIFIFCNSCSPQWHSACAIAEDGNVLAGHVCSSHDFIPNDMGVTSDWKHEDYSKHYPTGFELVLVEDPGTHEGIKAAFSAHQALNVEEEDCQHEVCVAARAGKQIMGPSHDAKSTCESGGRPHCACDVCF